MLILTIAIAIVLATRREARADDGDARTRAAALYAAAEREDDELELGRALEHYDAARKLDPGARFAPRADARAAQLRAHAEGDFVPFAHLERIRRDPSLGSNVQVIDALAAEIETWPPGASRVEGWALAAEANARRLHRPDKAIEQYRRIANEPGADPVLAKHAARELVGLEVARGDLHGAEAAAGTAGGRGDPRLAKDVARLVRRGHVHLASIAMLLAVVLLTGAAWGRAMRAKKVNGAVTGAVRKIAPLAIGYAVYVAVVGGVLASSYESASARPFLWFGVALVPVVLVARAWAAAGADGPNARAVRAVMCGASALAAAFLVVESVDASYLEGLGL